MTLWYTSTDERGREAERKEKPGRLRRSIIQGHFQPVPSGTCFGNGEVHGTYSKWRLNNSFQAHANWDGSEVALYNTTPQTAQFLFSLRLTPTTLPTLIQPLCHPPTSAHCKTTLVTCDSWKKTFSVSWPTMTVY